MPMLGLVEVGLPPQVALHALVDERQVLRVDLLLAPLLDRQLGGALRQAEDAIEAVAVDRVVDDVPIPEAITATPQAQLPAHLALAQGLDERLLLAPAPPEQMQDDTGGDHSDEGKDQKHRGHRPSEMVRGAAGQG